MHFSESLCCAVCWTSLWRRLDNEAGPCVCRVCGKTHKRMVVCGVEEECRRLF